MLSPEEIVYQALRLDQTERQAFLEQACENNAELRSVVDQQLKSILDIAVFPLGGQPSSGDSGITRAAQPDSLELSPTQTTFASTSAIGQQIGPYKLLQQLGEGGMGTVYMAEQREPVRRRVALKIIRAGADGGQVVARFEAERQALAMMDHPNIARVLDAGTTEHGSPYFVMELVKGTPVTDFCDDNKLSIRQRLMLFIDVCSAVQHAHQKGIIHRDLKPSNILVTMHDDRAVPKVIDFGVAKATHQRLTEKTMFTAYGQVVGTLEYMSPEQAQLTDLDIDTRSDIYSLGVLLYELLTGSTPLKRESLRDAALLDVLKRIKDEEPQRPSTRISESRDALDHISAVRQVEPKRFSLLMKGDLDWIVLKALEKDRTRRYETANAFSADVRRFLENEPIAARPPSTSYRLRKLVSKNRIFFGFLSTVAAMLLVGIGVSSYLARWALSEADTAKAAMASAEAEMEKARAARALADQRRDEAETQHAVAERQRQEAEASAKRSQAILDVLVSAFRSVNPSEQDFLGADTVPNLPNSANAPTASLRQGVDMQARDVLIRAQESLASDQLLKDDPLAKAEILYALSRSFSGIGDYARALQTAQQVVELKAASLGDDHVETLRASLWLGDAYHRAGDLGQAAQVLETTLAKQTKLLGLDDPDTVATCARLAILYTQQGLADKAIPMLENSLEHQPSSDAKFNRSKSFLLHSLALAYAALGNTNRAIEINQQILKERQQALGVNHPDSLGSMHNLGNLYYRQGDYDRAIELFETTLEKKRAVLGPDHPRTLNTMSNLASSYYSRGDLERATAMLEATWEKQRSVQGENHPDTLNTLNNLANSYYSLGELDQAIAQYEIALNKRMEVLGKDHPDTVRSINNLSVAYRDQTEDLLEAEDYVQAESTARRCIALVQSRPSSRLTLPFAQCMLAAALSGQGKLDEASDLFRTAIPDLKRRTRVASVRLKALRWESQHFVRSKQSDSLAQLEPELHELQRAVDREDKLAQVLTARQAGAPHPLQPIIELESSLRNTLADHPNDTAARMDACYYCRYLLSQSGSDSQSIDAEAIQARIVADLRFLREHAPDGHSDPLSNDEELMLHYAFGFPLITPSDDWTLQDSTQRINTLIPKCSEDARSELCTTFNNQAWKAATSPAPEQQDGPLAVVLATIASEYCATGLKSRYLDTLAAAQARAGDFTAATATMHQALDSLKQEADGKAIPNDVDNLYQERIKLFASGQPFTEAND